MNKPSSPGVGNLVAVLHDSVAVGYSEWFGFMIQEFLACIAEGIPFENGSIADGYHAAAVLEAILEASRKD